MVQLKTNMVQKPERVYCEQVEVLPSANNQRRGRAVLDSLRLARWLDRLA